jgi:PAS domain S-box-containing protein
MSHDEHMDRQIERLRRLVHVRWIVVPGVIVLGMVVAVMVNGSLIKLTESFLLALVVLGYNLAFHLTIPRLGSARSLTIHSWLQILLDLVAITAVILLSGGMSSPFALLYILDIISASFVLPARGAYVIASLSSLTYGLLLAGEYTGLIAPTYSFYPNGNAITSDQQAVWARYFLTVAGLLCASAFLTDYLAGQVHAGEERVRQQLAEMTTLFNAGTALASRLDLSDVLHGIVEQMAQALNATSCYVSDWDPANRTWTVLAEYASPQATPQERTLQVGVKYHEEDLPQAAASLRDLQTILIRVSDPAGDAAYRELLVKHGARSALLLPLVTRREVFGLAEAWDSRHEREFTPDEIRLAHTFATQAALAIERARLYTQVRTEQEQLRAVLESTGDAVVVTDQQGTILLFNRAAERTFGVTAGQVIGQPLSETVPPLVKPMNEVLRSPEAQAHDCEVTLPDKRTLVCGLEPLRAADGTLRGWVGVLHDVTHFKELDRIKSERVATVSHDLRGPLHLTRGYFDALVEALGPFTDDKQILVNTVRRSLNRIEALVTNLLDLEKIEAGAGMNWERCDLGLLIADAIADLEMSATDKGITLSAEMPLTLPLVWGDPCWLAQAFQNLLDNAVKFARSGDSVAVRAGLEAATVVVSVADTGPGIPAGDLEHIFDRFYRGKHQVLGRPRGTGLGLAIVKSIVEHHSGRVWAESQVGQGSTFYVALPIASTDIPTLKPVTGDGSKSV